MRSALITFSESFLFLWNVDLVPSRPDFFVGFAVVPNLFCGVQARSLHRVMMLDTRYRWYMIHGAWYGVVVQTIELGQHNLR